MKLSVQGIHLSLSMMDLSIAAMGCAQPDSALGLLASRGALLGSLDSVIDRVANEVCERILDGFEQRAVEFRFLAFLLQISLLATSDRQVANHAGQFSPNRGHRLHPSLDNPLL